MKKLHLSSFALAGMLLLTMPVLAQENDTDSTGLPGDHFSLQGALELFKKANSIEEFEKLLNTESNHVNNLDLDGDNEIDYIKVIAKKDEGANVFILQVAASENENQDIAVIELEKTGSEYATIQIVGDEEIFGEETIVEPGDADSESNIDAVDNTDVKGPNSNFALDIDAGVVVNVWFWPSVRFVYAPGYRIWVSPWRYHYYPAWWRPWRPLGWHVWHPYRGYYHRNYVVVHTHRMVHARRIYTPYRATSVTVHTRHAVARKNYTVTRNRTTVTGPRGNSATKTTTTVRGKNGKVKGSKTTVKKRRG